MCNVYSNMTKRNISNLVPLLVCVNIISLIFNVKFSVQFQLFWGLYFQVSLQLRILLWFCPCTQCHQPTASFSSYKMTLEMFLLGQIFPVINCKLCMQENALKCTDLQCCLIEALQLGFSSRPLSLYCALPPPPDNIVHRQKDAYYVDWRLKMAGWMVSPGMGNSCPVLKSWIQTGFSVLQFLHGRTQNLAWIRLLSSGVAHSRCDMMLKSCSRLLSWVLIYLFF